MVTVKYCCKIGANSASEGEGGGEGVEERATVMFGIVINHTITTPHTIFL